MNDYTKPSGNLTIDDLTIHKDMQISDTFEVTNIAQGEYHNKYIENEINALLKKYDLSLEGLEAFIEKYEPERLI